MIIPKPFEAAPVPVGDSSRETIEYAPTSAVFPLPIIVIGTSGVTLFTVPDDEYWEIKMLSLHNLLASGNSFDLHLASPGEGITATNRVYSQSLGANETTNLDGLTGLVIGPNGLLRGAANANNVTLFGGVRRHFRGSRRD